MTPDEQVLHGLDATAWLAEHETSLFNDMDVLDLNLLIHSIEDGHLDLVLPPPGTDAEPTLRITPAGRLFAERNRP